MKISSSSDDKKKTVRSIARYRTKRNGNTDASGTNI